MDEVVLKPEVLLIDEPLANIDRETDGLLETVNASHPALEGGKVAIQHPPVRRQPTFEIHPPFCRAGGSLRVAPYVPAGGTVPLSMGMTN